MTSLRRLVALGLLAAVLLPAAAYASQQKRALTLERQAVTADQLPATVTAGIQSAYPKATIVDAFKIARGADSMYEVTIKASPEGTPFMVVATPDGKVRSLARTPKGGLKTPLAKTPAPGTGKTPLPGDPVVLDQLPKAVTKAIKDAYPRDTLVQAFKITTGGEIAYEVVLDDVSSVQPLRVLVSADGKIQKR